MKRYISILIVITLLLSHIDTFAEESANDGSLLSNIWGGITDAAGNAADWASGAAEDAVDWAGSTAGDAANWISGAASDTLNWTSNAANDAWSWTKDAANDAWNWTENAAGDVWIWTQGAANDAWGWTQDATGNASTWVTNAAGDAWDWTKGAAGDAWRSTKESAEAAWTITTRQLQGTWEDIFGSASDEVDPHHICVSSPLFQSVHFVGSYTNSDGSNIECYSYDDTYDISIIAISRAPEIVPPYVGDIQFVDLVASAYDSITFVNEEAEGVGVRALAQELRFKAIQDDNPVFGRALGVWTDHYCVGFVITVNTIIDESGANITELKEADRLFDLWIETLSIYETKGYEVEKQEIADEAILSGNLTASNIKVANRIIDEARFHARQGHGFAAEAANTLSDNIRGIFRGQKAKVIGNDNLKNGPDRLLTTPEGTYYIQTKYYQTAQGCINACFDLNGNYRYYDVSGKPMQVEVPRDKYDDAVAIMRQYISEGRVNGISDPAEAENIVRQGSVTYKQALRIAKAGTIESLTYDAVNACVESAYSFGISAVVEFAVSAWNGEKLDVSIKRSIYTGLKVAGTSFVISIVASQLSKAGLNSLLVNSSEAVVQFMGPKAAAVLVNSVRTGGNVYGAAAMRSAAKMLRSNAITAAVSFVVLSIPDAADAFRGRISGKQLLKNMAETGSGIAGGIGGWYGGAALGTMVFPGVGTVIGGIIFSVAGGLIAQFATSKLTDMIAPDDADEMLDIIAEEYKSIAEEYLLNESESEDAIQQLNSIIDAELLKNMFASSDRELYASEIILRPIIENVTQKRAVIKIPSEQEYQETVIEVMEDIYDEERLAEVA